MNFSNIYYPRKKNNFLLLILAACLLLSTILYSASMSADAAIAAVGHRNTRTVKVAWYNLDGMQEGESDNTLSGYNYEYLETLSLYTGWKYEYVYGNWTTLEKKFQDGEIDIMGFREKTPENQEKFLFPNYSSGLCSYSIIANPDNDEFEVNDHKAMDKKKIVLNHTSITKLLLTNFKEDNNIDLDVVYADNSKEELELLEKGEVDLALVSDFASLRNYKILYQFAKEPFYFAVTPSRTDILTELNEGLSTLLSEDYNFNERLNEKYFSNATYTDFISFSSSEKEFIRKSKPIQVAVAKGYYPLAYTDDITGKSAGFIYDYLDLMSERCGLTFEVKEYDTYADALWAVQLGRADITLQIPDDFTYSHHKQLDMTQSYLSLQNGLLCKKNSNIKTIAVETNRNISTSLKNNADYHFYYCDNLSSCIKAIENGKADAVLINFYSYQQIVSEHKDEEFIFQPYTDGYTDYCIGITGHADVCLYYVLMKTISNIQPSDTQLLLSSIASTYQTRQSFSAWAKENRYAILLVIVIVIGLILFIIAFFEMRMSRLQRISNNTLAEKNNELQLANAAKSDFLARTSHDLRTPMNAIMGLTALAMDEPNPNEKDFYLGQISTSSEFLLGLINDVLDMEKIDSGSIELKPEPYPFQDFAQMIKTMISPLCKGKNLEFIFESGGFDETLIVDHTRFNQIFFNLLSNSVKFTPPFGTVTFAITQQRTEGSIAILDFMIADTGIGMSKEFQDHMFEPFTQENRTDDSKMGGTGLGLSIVKKMVDLMGGTMTVESNLNEGSIFLISLTLPITRDKKEATGLIDPIALDDFLKDKEILLVDDQPLNLEVAKKILEKKHMKVTIATNGKNAADIFSLSDVGHFDAILMDIRMPVMNGLESTMAIRAMTRDDASTIPILAMTANTFDEDKEKSKKAGMNAHLGKPIIPKELFEALYRQIKAREDK
ncbi:MAG: transporter substrate-binding domain-containing protein [Lachnospiraceae bacterium]|nr:transporter substrate-binding domain-containing protein [Lachnospiraceae bacterium]